MIASLLLLLACETEPVTPPPSAVERADAAAQALYASSAPTSVAPAPSGADPSVPVADDIGGPPVDVTFRWFDIAALYRGFMAQPVVTDSLGRALRGVTTSPVRLVVSYDEPAVRGYIRMKYTENGLVHPVRMEGDVIQLQDFAPVFVALSGYRRELGTRYDLRLLNFRIGVDATASTVGCIFTPAGEPSSDGTVVSPCVEVNGASVCGVPGVDGVRFDPGAADAIRTCLTRPVMKPD